MYKKLIIIISLASLATCLGAPILYYLGEVTEAGFKSTFLFASILWFVFATLWSAKSKPDTSSV